MSETEQAAHAGVAPKVRRWPLALLVGFLTGIAGAFLAAPLSDWAMEAHHVSTMEGGRACAVVAIWMPLAFLAGFVIGFVVGLRLPGTGFAGYARRQAIALVIIAAAVAGTAGLAWAAADHPPRIDGKALALDIEVRVPRKGRSIEDLHAARFEVALVVSASDRNYSAMRWTEASATDEFITVPAWALLRSRNGTRDITAGVEGENRQIFTAILPASPKQIDEGWPNWTPPRARFDGSKPAPEDEYTVRYRVRFADEYSPGAADIGPAKDNTSDSAGDRSPETAASP